MTDSFWHDFCYNYFSASRTDDERQKFAKLDIITQLSALITYESMCNSPYISEVEAIAMRAVAEIERLRDEEARRNV